MESELLNISDCLLRCHVSQLIGGCAVVRLASAIVTVLENNSETVEPLVEGTKYAFRGEKIDRILERGFAAYIEKDWASRFVVCAIDNVSLGESSSGMRLVARGIGEVVDL